MESLVIGKVRRLTDEHDKKYLGWEEDEISIEMNVGRTDLVGVSERENIIVDALGDDKGSTSFCWRIKDETRKDYKQAMHREDETNLINMHCIKVEGRSTIDMRCINASGRKSAGERHVCNKNNIVETIDVSCTPR